jgi:hypothetical protein
MVRPLVPTLVLASSWLCLGIFRFPAEAKDFSASLCVQTSFEAHPASYPMGNGGPFPGVKRGRDVTLTTHPLSAEVNNE